MANVRTFVLPHYSQHPIHVTLFKNVSNAAFLRAQLLEANPEFDYAFLDATMILTPSHLLTATFLALHAHLTNRLKARTPHSELVFRFHPNNNIGESYRTFGITDTTTHLIAVKLGLEQEVTSDSVARHLGEHVQGESILIGEDGEELGQFVDIEKVRKVYKLNNLGNRGDKKVVVNGMTGDVDERKEMEAMILGMMTIKGS